MQIKGWHRTSLIDYPDHIATVVFTGGCNFRCPMCHNAELVLKPQTLPTYPEEDLWEFLTKRAGMVTGLVVTGGEPTLQPDLSTFLKRARAHKVHIKLDTNGYRPDMLDNLLTEGLLDYIAMDVKAPPTKYAQLTGTPDVDITRIERSLRLIRESGAAYEFRTTVVPGLLNADDIESIARWIAGAARYVLQQFRGDHTLDPHQAHQAPYPVNDLRAMAEHTRHWVSNTTLRGA
jgi:pyruvate formate lyase activating enzyme